MVEKRSKKGRLYEGGNECLRYKIESPYIENCEAVNSLFEKIAKECEIFCNESLFDGIRGKKKLYRYELTFSVAHDDGQVISLIFHARLMEKECISERFFAMTLSVVEERMIAPSILLKRFGGKRCKEKIAGTPFLRGENIAYLTPDGQELFAKDK